MAETSSSADRALTPCRERRPGPDRPERPATTTSVAAGRGPADGRLRADRRRCHGSRHRDGGTRPTSPTSPGSLHDPDHRLWIDLASPSHDEIRIVADALGLHPLIAEDIAERNQRAKVETFDDGLVHVVLFALDYAGEATRVRDRLRPRRRATC